MEGSGNEAVTPESGNGATMRAQGWATTDVGQVRDHNEDSFLIDEDLQLYLVADGMGGHACGEVASELAAATFKEKLAEGRETLERFRTGADGVGPDDLTGLMERAMLAACRTVFETAQKDPNKRGMGTTCSGLVIAGDRGFVSHVGDSRIYLVRDGRAVQLTRDHSVLNELVESGSIDAEAAKSPEFAGYRNALARAVGVCAEVEVDTFQLEILPGDAFILGSDGLFHYAQPEELPGAVELGETAATDFLTGLANDRGGHDNITCVMVVVESSAPASPATIARTAEFTRKVNAFRRIPLFRHLDYKQLIRVLSSTQVEPYESAQTILEEGDEGDALFVVLTGKVRLEKGGVPLTVIGPGSHFGELSLIDRSPRSATANVVEDARLLCLKRESLHELVRKEPRIAVKLLWSVAEVFAARLRRTTAALTDAQNANLAAADAISGKAGQEAMAEESEDVDEEPAPEAAEDAPDDGDEEAEKESA